jgi:hypothetical protein
MQAEVSEGYSLVIIATMAINTNDCFTALNGSTVSALITLNQRE